MGWGAPRTTLVGALSLVAAGGHAVYPAVLAWLTRGRGDPEAPTPPFWPAITVVVPAYLEEAVIGAKVADIAANGYPGAVEVTVVADDEATARRAGEAGARVLANPVRAGKPAAVNRGVSAAGTDIVVLTDANTALAPGSLAALVRWFEDPTIAAVAGEKRVTGGREGLYWRFESWLKRREFRAGTTVGLVGELYAVRRSAFRPVPHDVPVDDLWIALDILASGRRIAYEPAAASVEAASSSWRADWERRTRNTTLILDALVRRRSLLRPRCGLIALQLWGHRLVRSSIGPLAHLALLAVALGSARTNRLAAAFVAAHGAGAVAAVRTVRGASQSRIERIAGQVLFLQAVALRGLVRYLSGDRSPLWPKPPRDGVLPSPAQAA